MTRFTLIRTAKLVSCLTLLCLFAGSLAPCAAAEIVRGKGQQIVNVGGRKITVFHYRPDCAEPSLLLVFHGVDRNADRYRDNAQPLGDRLCMIVVAPEFERKAFPSWRYQLGGVVRNGVVQPEQDWTGQMVIDLVDWVRKQEGRSLPYSLLGHSAGGQFLSRVAAYTTTEARRIVIANPSSQALPTTDVRAPYGLGGIYKNENAKAELKRYLAAPVTILLGQNDIGDKNLSEQPEAKAQGKTRYERGKNAFDIAKIQARENGMTFNWRLVEVPGVGHNARKMFSSPLAQAALAP